MKLLSIKIENFKGIKAFEVNFEGRDTVLTGANGTGKTSVYDAFLYLLFGKDSSGRKEFGLRPLDANNDPIPKLVTKVEATIWDGDDMEYTLRKENHENTVKGQLRGYTTLCWINEVPKKVGEYQKNIDAIIPEDTFKMLTDCHYFNDKLKWQDRREILLELAGDIPEPDGFEDLMRKLNGSDMNDHKKILTEQKKRVTKERDEIGPRIDEIHKGMPDLETGEGNIGAEDLQEQRQGFLDKKKDLTEKRARIMDSEKKRQDQLTAINELEGQKVRREAELESSTEQTAALLVEKTDITVALREKQTTYELALNAEAAIRRSLANNRSELDSCSERLTKIRDTYKAASEAPLEGTCYACGQNLPDDKLAEAKAKQEKELAAITKHGNDTMADVKNAKASIAQAEENLKAQTDTTAKLKEQLDAAQAKADKRMAEIDEAINNREKPDPKTDRIWLAICEDIEKLQKLVGEPAGDQIDEITKQIDFNEDRIQHLNDVLAQGDRIKRDHKRIAELRDKEKTLSGQLAAIEQQLADIADYKAQESGLIEKAVNDRFKHITFRLFNYLLNGTTEDCCEAMIGGVGYPDASYGQKILMGIDVINILADHYQTHCPIFIDNAESLTYELECPGQMIQLQADPNEPKLATFYGEDE
jgi:DNA repair exonuclease SbcCD ATPase subunit